MSPFDMMFAAEIYKLLSNGKERRYQLRSVTGTLLVAFVMVTGGACGH